MQRNEFIDEKVNKLQYQFINAFILKLEKSPQDFKIYKERIDHAEFNLKRLVNVLNSYTHFDHVDAFEHVNFNEETLIYIDTNKWLWNPESYKIQEQESKWSSVCGGCWNSYPKECEKCEKKRIAASLKEIKTNNSSIEQVD